MAKKLGTLQMKSKSEYHGLEAQLRAALRPISPRPEFVGDLRRLLDHRARHPELDSALDNGQVLLMIAVSLLSIVLVVVMSARAIALLASGLGMIQHLRQREQAERGGIRPAVGLTRGQA